MKLLTRRGVLVEDMDQTDLAEPGADEDEARRLRPQQKAWPCMLDVRTWSISSPPARRARQIAEHIPPSPKRLIVAILFSIMPMTTVSTMPPIPPPAASLSMPPRALAPEAAPTPDTAL
jgi:hypothetical protein